MYAASIFPGASSLYKSHAIFPLLLHKPTHLPLPSLQLLSSSLLPPLSVIATMPHRSSSEPPPCLPLAESPRRHYLAVLGKPISSSVVHVTSVLISYEPVYYEEDAGHSLNQKERIDIKLQLNMIRSSPFCKINSNHEVKKHSSIFPGASSLYKSHAIFPLLLHKPTPLPLPSSQLLSSSLLPPLSVIATMPHRSSNEPPPCLPLAESPRRHYLAVLGKPISSSVVHVTSVLISYDYDAVEDLKFYPEVPPSPFAEQGKSSTTPVESVDHH
ncbi:hypothetical protein GUJ93_ZPchr0002g24760 [Zizania palustris]|uniref:Uncharacterized protein n=1 Tax=Zizania palustris TaxID=103762 RepID=A0A8J5VWV7_ZIZPA|nr:hypothetical protein GUJ93_ZPchr0002g24760 [Zizania palustris]